MKWTRVGHNHWDAHVDGCYAGSVDLYCDAWYTMDCNGAQVACAGDAEAAKVALANHFEENDDDFRNKYRHILD